MLKSPVPAAGKPRLLATLALAALTLTAGCGSSNHTIGLNSIGATAVKSQKRGKLTFTLKWPNHSTKVKTTVKNGKLVPVAAQAVQFKVFKASAPTVAIATYVVTAPTPVVDPTTGAITDTTTYVTPLLDLDTYEVQAAAYPGGTATTPTVAGTVTGYALAAATTPPIVLTVDNPTPTVGLTMQGAVKTLALTSVPASVADSTGVKSVTLKNSSPAVDQTLLLTATAYDAAGDILMVNGAIDYYLDTNTSSTTRVTASTTTPVTGTVSDGIVTVSDTNNVGSATLVTSQTATGPAVVHAEYYEPYDSSVNTGTAPTDYVQATDFINVTVAPVGLSTSAWPKFHGDVGNTGEAAIPASGSPAIAATKGKSFIIGNQIVYSSPTINLANDTVYIGADDNNLYAATIDSAGVESLKWPVPFTTGGAIEGAPLIDVNGTIYIGSQDGYMYALKDVPDVPAKPATPTTPATKDVPAHAQLVWKFYAGSAITGSATIDKKGVLYFGTEPTYDGSGNVSVPGRVFYLDALSGNQINNAAGSPIVFTGDTVGYNNTPALDQAQDLVYVTAESGNLYALSTTTGAVRAMYPLQGDTINHCSPVVAPVSGTETLFQGTVNGKLYAFRAAGINDGPVANFTPYTVTGSILATPAYDAQYQTLVVATYDNSSGQNDSRISVVDANSGTEIARTTPILTYLATKDNPLTPADLSQAQAFLFASSPAISSDGSTVYVGCEDGHVYSVTVTGLTGSTPTGSYLPFTSLLETEGNSQINPILVDSSPAIGVDGHVYIGGFDGSVYSVTP